MTTTTLEPTVTPAPGTSATVLLDIAVGDIVPDPNNQYRPTTKAFEVKLTRFGGLVG